MTSELQLPTGSATRSAPPLPRGRGARFRSNSFSESPTSYGPTWTCGVFDSSGPARCPSLRQAATSDGTSTTRSTRPRSTKRGARCSTRRPPPLHRVSVGGYTRRRRHYRAGPWCTVHCSWARGGVGRGRRRAHRPPGATEVPEGEWQPFGLLWRRSNQVCYL